MTSRMMYTSSDFLSHDAAPKDMASYQPSQGPTSRDHRFKGYTKTQMMSEKPPITENLMNKPQQRHPRKKTQVTNPITESAQNPSEFFAGKQSKPIKRQSDATLLKDRFVPEPEREAVKQRAKQHQEQIESYMYRVREEKQQAMMQRKQQKQRDLEELKSYDPWSKQGGAPRPTNRKVKAPEAQPSSDTYVDKFFGKAGAGAPVRTGSGRTRTTFSNDPETQMTNLFRGNLGAHVNQEFNRTAQDQAAQYNADLAQQQQERMEMQRQEREHSTKLTSRHNQAYAEKFAVSQYGLPTGPDGKVHAGRVDRMIPKRDRMSKTEAQKHNQALSHQSYAHKQRQQEQKRHDVAESGSFTTRSSAPDRTDSGSVRAYRKKVVEPQNGSTDPTMADQLAKSRGRQQINPRRREVISKLGGTEPPAPKPLAVAAKTPKEITPEMKRSMAERQAYLQEQQNMIAQKRSEIQNQRAHDHESRQDAYFEFGKDLNASGKHPASDIRQMHDDVGGGLGRKQKTGYSKQLYTTLEKQSAERKQKMNSERSHSMSLEKTHVEVATKIFGGEMEPGPGVPRKDPKTGETIGTVIRDKNDIHVNEARGPALMSKQTKQKYGGDLRSAAEAKRLYETNRKRDSADAGARHQEHMKESLGRKHAGGGAPLRNKEGDITAVPAALREKGDVEWKVNNVKNFH